MTFEKWLNKCAKIALSDEWCIDPDMPEWRIWFKAGLTPELAVGELFEMVEHIDEYHEHH